jgi:membrane protein DedA with SNARE-associated domain
VTAQLVDWLTREIGSRGLPAVFFLMLLESACIPVPSEAIMLFAGFLVSAHQMSFWGAVAAGVAGNVAGSWIAWAVGAYGGRTLILRHGRWFHITPARLEQADDWFQRYGARVVFFSRCIPVIRTFISLPAGIARMDFRRFTIYTLLGCIPWVILLTLIGVQVGSAWRTWHDRLAFLDYVVAVLIVAAIVWLVIRAVRGRAAGAEG